MAKIYNLVVILGTLGIFILLGSVNQPLPPLWLAIVLSIVAFPTMFWGVAASVKLDFMENSSKGFLLAAIGTTLGGLGTLTYLWEPILQPH